MRCWARIGPKARRSAPAPACADGWVFGARIVAFWRRESSRLGGANRRAYATVTGPAIRVPCGPDAAAGAARRRSRRRRGGAGVGTFYIFKKSLKS